MMHHCNPDNLSVGKISEANITDALRDIRIALLEADVEFGVAKEFIQKVKEKSIGEDVLKSIKPGGTHETGSGWHGDRVLDFLNDRDAKKDARPIFIYFGLSHPHDVRDGTPELLVKYGATNPTKPISPPPPQHAAKLAEMRALLLAEMHRLGDPWRFAFQADDGLTPGTGDLRHRN